ncbi:BPTI/Kunitz domain-containing protein [Amyelois transitella]|uniref:BPTI/Kunitz domain-containing protein n=1 Tax=Amyelois transitella TaxID=680683 RepID=UPI00067BB5E4|nr:BPTI/Kunitz domain-containing protein [Amyelois transitella]
MPLDKTLRARHKACFLRPDTGPCRADILQWYYDVIKRKCYRFFWGGCQGNGNRFETEKDCREYCALNSTHPPVKIPFFCNLAFDYGTCFADYQRWTFDKFSKTCRLRLYSGCGGNQNNFETKEACAKTCISYPNSTFNSYHNYNICIPLSMADYN